MIKDRVSLVIIASVRYWVLPWHQWYANISCIILPLVKNLHNYWTAIFWSHSSHVDCRYYSQWPCLWNIHRLCRHWDHTFKLSDSVDMWQVTVFLKVVAQLSIHRVLIDSYKSPFCKKDMPRLRVGNSCMLYR